MGESYLNRIIKTGTSTEGYIRSTGVPNGESILANAPVIENSGTNYYPIYYMCLMDTVASISFAKTGTGVSTGADAFVFSDEPSTLYVGDTTHTFNTANDYETSEIWKCRYVIAYATETNKNDANGITINLYNYKTTFEFIGGQYLKLSSSSALFGYSDDASSNENLRYVNLSNSSFYNNEISTTYFCASCHTLETILFPSSLANITNSYCLRYCHSLTALSLPNVISVESDFCYGCYSLESLSLPLLQTISNKFGYLWYNLTSLSLPELTAIGGTNCFYGCSSLKTLSIPKVTSITGTNCFIYCYSLEYLELSSTTVVFNNMTANTLAYTQFIKLYTNFNINNCNFTGYTGYNKSLAWFTHLATQLKDNSSGSAKTMTLGASNIALIPSAQATIISNKNWTIN